MNTSKRSNDDKIKLFVSLFQGLKNVYGTYDPDTSKHWQERKGVTRDVILNHLSGKNPYGFYPLMEDRTLVAVADFDNQNCEPPLNFINRANHYGLAAYLEKSKSKGYHVWMFFEKKGIDAWKIRMVMQYLLEEIEASDTEIFPKQDSLSKTNEFGNFINAPLFGKLVAEGRTVFIQPDKSLQQYPNQWEVLESIKRIKVSEIDEIIETNELKRSEDQHSTVEKTTETTNENYKVNGFALPVCIRKILSEGVTFDQRVACFRLAIHLQRVGIPQDIAQIILIEWSNKNKPVENKEIITEEEIIEQTKNGYKEKYTGYGCHINIIRAFCNTTCPIKMKNPR
ncbi:hypothetical protein ACFL6P_05100 [Candidatus Latescibacterota bacterium]